jgi:hypothetical protein
MSRTRTSKNLTSISTVPSSTSKNLEKSGWRKMMMVMMMTRRWSILSLKTIFFCKIHEKTQNQLITIRSPESRGFSPNICSKLTTIYVAVHWHLPCQLLEVCCILVCKAIWILPSKGWGVWPKRTSESYLKKLHTDDTVRCGDCWWIWMKTCLSMMSRNLSLVVDQNSMSLSYLSLIASCVDSFIHIYMLAIYVINTLIT